MNSNTVTVIRLFLLLAVVSPVADAQWVPTDGPYGGDILSIACMDADIFVGTNAGTVYRSTNQGGSWLKVSAGLPSTYGVQLAASGTALFAGTDGGVWRSTDRGAQWVPLNYIQSGVFAYPLVLSSGAPGTIYAGSCMGVLRTTDYGANWTRSDSGLPATCVISLLVAGNLVFAGTYQGVYVSKDNGTHWSLSSAAMAFPGVYALASIGTNIFAGTDGAGVYLSTDRGKTWSEADSGLTEVHVQSLAVTPDSSGTLVAGTIDGVFLSTNRGKSWRPATEGLANGFIRSLAARGSHLFAGTGSGMFSSTDNGTSWAASSDGMRETLVNCVVANESFLFAGTTGGVFRSSNSGRSWAFAGEGLSRRSSSVYSLGSRGATLFAGTSVGVFLSTDNGTLWTKVNTGLPAANIMSLAVTGTYCFAAPWGEGVYRSTPDGTSWFHASIGLTPTYQYALASDGTTVYASSHDGVFQTTNNGVSWVPVGPPVSRAVGAIALVGTAVLVGGGQGIFRWRPGETVWTDVTSGQGIDWVTDIVTSGANIFAGTFGQGFFLSTKGGESWAVANDGLENLQITSVALRGGDLFAGTAYTGMYRRPVSELLTRVGDPRVDLPVGFRLDQNYPNPFNPSTMIGYQIPAEGHVTLNIYDLLGREVAMLVNGRKLSGRYQATFDASTVAAGLYFYRLTSGGHVESRKMLLIR